MNPYRIVFDQRTARWEVVTFDPMQAEPEVAAPEGKGQFDEFNPYHTRVPWFVDHDGVIHMGERGQGHGDLPEFQHVMQSNFERMGQGSGAVPLLAVGELHNGNMLTYSSLYPQHQIEPQIVELYNQRRAADPNLPQYTGQHDFTPNMDPNVTMPAEDRFMPKKVDLGLNPFKRGHEEMIDPAELDAVMNAAQVKPEIIDPYGQTWVWDPSSHTYTRTAPTHDTDRSHAWGGDADLFDPATQSEKAKNPMQEGILAPTSSEHPGPGIYDGINTDPEDRPSWSATCRHCGGRESIFPSWHGPVPRGAVLCRHCGQQVNFADFLPETHEQVPDTLPGEGDTPGQIDTMLKHAEVPSQYPAWGEPHCDNCNEGLPQYREPKADGPRLCEKCENDPAVLEDLRRQFRRQSPQQEHRVGPFPERTPKPNPYKQDNSFPSMPTTKSHSADAVRSGSNQMPEFRHYHEEKAWREANGIAAGDASLDACPQCGDPSMVDDHQGHKVCTTCGHKQPIHDLRHMQEQIDAPGGFAEQMYDSILAPGLGPRQQSVHKLALCPPLLALAAPLMEGLGAETAGAALGGAVRAGAGALTDTGLKGFVARHAAGQALGGVGGQAADAVDSLNPGSADIGPADNAAMYSHLAADDDDKGGGIGSGDEGHDEDPDAGNQGFEEEHGDSPDLLKNTDMLGPGQEGGYSDEQHEALAHLEGCGPLIVSFIMANESGKDSPIISQLDKMLTTAFKGHAGFEHAYKTHSGEGDGDHFEESLEALKDDPNGDADSSDHPADPNEAAEVEERREDNESKESAVILSCIRCATPIYAHQTSCTRCGFDKTSMLPGQVPPSSATPAAAQGQPMPAAIDANSTACPVCGGTGGLHNPGCTAQPVAPQPQQPGMGMTASERIAARIPKNMCPFHRELVEYSLEFADPAKALSALSTQAFGEHSCKGSYEMGQTPAGRNKKCGYRPAMLQQTYWDDKDLQAEERRMERQVEITPTAPEPVVQEIPSDEALGDDHDWNPEPSWDRADDADAVTHDLDFDTMPSAVGMPDLQMAAASEFGDHVHDHQRHEDHSDMFDGSPDAAGAPAHDLTVNSNLWVDAAGRPLEKGASYLLKSPNYSIPDRITVEEINGDKLHVLVHTRYLSYENTLTPKQVTAEALSFEPDELGQDMAAPGMGLEDNNDDNTVAEAAGADQSDTYTPVSHITPEMKQLHPTRNWLWDDPEPLEDKTAGKDYTPREQRHFIDEPGRARNLDRLDLDGTHYIESPNFADHFNWGV